MTEFLSSEDAARRYARCLQLPFAALAGRAASAACQQQNVDRTFIMTEFEALRTLLDVMRCALSASSSLQAVLIYPDRLYMTCYQRSAHIHHDTD
jgi:hypothetical protein